MKDDIKKIVTGSVGELIAVAAVVATTVLVDMIYSSAEEHHRECGIPLHSRQAVHFPRQRHGS